MASLFSSYTTTLFTVVCFLLFSISVTSSSEKYSQEEEFAKLKTTNVEKITHLRFYFQQVIGGENFTAVVIVSRPEFFGLTVVIDDPLTQGPERDTKIIGRAQGMYANAAHNELVFLMAVVFEFTEGKYNGSSISMFGRNHIMDSEREMPIVGGSGVFRFGTGYALANTLKADFAKGTATVEYNVFVKHY